MVLYATYGSDDIVRGRVDAGQLKWGGGMGGGGRFILMLGGSDSSKHPQLAGFSAF